MNCNNIKLIFINPLSLICLVREFIASKNKSTEILDYLFALSLLFTGWFIIVGLLFKLFGTVPLLEYSQGDVHGKPAKLSTKGLIFKTNEGYLMTGGVENGSATKWYYSLQDTSLIDCINNNEEVTLSYKQYLFVPTRVGDTSYIVTSCKAK